MKMGKCLNIAMAQHEMDLKAVAEKAELSVSRISALKKADHWNTQNVTKLAKVFDMSESQFMALAG